MHWEEIGAWPPISAGDHRGGALGRGVIKDPGAVRRGIEVMAVRELEEGDQ